MARAIRKNMRNFIAIAVLVVIALATSYYIVKQQRLRIPILEAHPFTLHAEFQTAQAVVPGQGQTIDVAGVKVGDVQSVELKNGVADVTFGIDPKYVPIYRNATILLRPRTGLDDMFFQLDPGTKDAGEIPDGGTVPLQNTAPDVNLDEVLSALDGDTRASFNATTPFASQLGPTFNSLRPFARNLPQLNSSLISLSQKATPALRNRIRPLVRSARPDVSPLRLAANRFSTATPRLTVATNELNRFLTEASYNPHGANAPGTPGRDEGYLYWLGWAAHIGALTFATQDAHGAEWRVYLT